MGVMQAFHDDELSSGYWSTGVPSDARESSHVTIIGAGIVGLATAAALVRSGHSVTVVDENGSVGAGTSHGNGCQLSYGYVAPLAQPSLLLELPSLLLSKGAPLRIVPKPDPAQWRWMLGFVSACRGSVATKSSMELLALAAASRQETDLWVQGGNAQELCFSESGKLVVLPTEAALKKAIAQVKLQEGFGPKQYAVNEEECLRLEPALASFRGHVAGAIYTPSECAIDSLALCKDLEAQLRRRGVRFELGVNVHAFHTNRRRVTHIQTSAGRFEVDQLVLATGAGSASVTKKLGFNVPVYPLKGFSITARIKDPDAVPTMSVTDAAKKVVYARIGQRLRVAGVAEIRGYDKSVNPKRIDELVRYTKQAFGSAVELEPGSAWAGLRPATPTSVPMIGRSPVANVYLNVGHGALGLTLAFGAARRLADLMTENQDKGRRL